LKKRGAERGFLMVNLWWDRGDLWCIGWCFFTLENFSRIADLFLSDSRFGNSRVFRPGAQSSSAILRLRAYSMSVRKAHPSLPVPPPNSSQNRWSPPHPIFRDFIATTYQNHLRLTPAETESQFERNL
jgi:hypothetical protein